MSAAVQGEERCSRWAVEMGPTHISCAKDAKTFVVLAVAVDLNMDACKLLSCKLRLELPLSRSELQ